MSATAIYAAGMEVSEGGAIYAVLESRHATVRGMDDYLTQGVMGSDRCGNSDVGKCNAARHRSLPGQNLAVDRRSGHGARRRCRLPS